MANYCYKCGQEVHFDPRIKSKNDKFIPLQGKTGVAQHDCPANPFNNKYSKKKRRSYDYSYKDRWNYNNNYNYNYRRQQQQQAPPPPPPPSSPSERLRQYFATLGLPPFCKNADQVKEAYRKLALIYHPDRSSNSDTASKFREIQEAYEVCLKELLAA